MKFVRKLVMLLLILSVLFGLFVFVYSYRPDVIEAVFHPEQRQAEVNLAGGDSDNNGNFGQQDGGPVSAGGAGDQPPTGMTGGMDNSGQYKEPQGEEFIPNIFRPGSQILLYQSRYPAETDISRYRKKGSRLKRKRPKSWKVSLVPVRPATVLFLTQSITLIMECWMKRESIFTGRFMPMRML